MSVEKIGIEKRSGKRISKINLKLSEKDCDE